MLTRARMVAPGRSGRAGDALPVLAVVVVTTALVTWRHGDLTDLFVYRYGGRAVIDGASLYATHDPVTGLPFTYPPFAALLMVPATLVPPALAQALWTGLSVAALAATVGLSLRAAGRRTRGWLVALLTLGAVGFEPVWQNLTFGQINTLVMLAVLVDLLRPDRRWSGVLVGLAAGVKLTPLVFVVLLVMVGRRGAAGRAVAAFAATVVAGLALVPGGAAYWNERLVDASRVGPPALAHNQSAYGVLTRLFDTEPSLLAWSTVAGALSLAVLLVAAAWWRRGERLLGTCLGAIAMLIASPVSWSHHWVWAVPLTLAVWESSRVAAVAWGAVFVARPIVWPPYGEGRELGWSWAEQVVGTGYFLAALGVAAWAGVVLARRRAGPGQAASATVSCEMPPGMTVGGQSQVSSHSR